jgi:glycosyltransferase involved in cell wall biosynthesis
MIRRRKIAVDLTPLTNNSRIGGAKGLTLEVIRNFAGKKSEFDYLLLTCEDTHAELAALDADNIERVCVKKSTLDLAGPRARQVLHLFVNTILPASIRKWVKRIYRRKTATADGEADLLSGLGVDLLFCPFTGPLYYTPGIPTVSVVYDLQFLEYPENFSKLDLLYLEEHFQEACQLSAHLVTDSEFVKQSILERSRRRPEEITVIYAGVQERLIREQVPEPGVLAQYGLRAGGFLFYPAKYWPHKNHLNALLGFREYLEGDVKELKLVFTGFDPAEKEKLQREVERLGLAGKVVILGWVSESELAGLLQYCAAVLFPSFYEGFGIPVLEAFQFEKPLLCSKAASLPEIAGEAAIYFDPRSPGGIAEAITRLMSDLQLQADLVEKGRSRLAAFPDSREVAAQFEGVFNQVLNDG